MEAFAQQLVALMVQHAVGAPVDPIGGVRRVAVGDAGVGVQLRVLLRTGAPGAATEGILQLKGWLPRSS